MRCIHGNTKDFVPQPGDWGVWTGGWAGHVNIVVGPCTKDYWYGGNNANPCK
ncbi:hypothetical protein I5B93_04285 [Staphylococcus aureus]|nr:hypothetical protein I5B93_04285 [Staphylococcus aureus]